MDKRHTMHAAISRILAGGLLMVICFSSFLSMAHASIQYYVAPGLSSGNNDGSSWQNAWRSFSNINWTTLHNASASQPVYLYVKRGTTSNVRLIIGSSGTNDTNRIIITTDPTDSGANPIISGVASDRLILTNGHSYITIQNFELTNPGVTGCYGGIYVSATSKYITIDSNWIHDTKASAITIVGSGTATNLLINNNVLEDNGDCGGGYTYPCISGMGDYSTVSNNTIRRCCNDGIQGTPSYGYVLNNDLSDMGRATNCQNTHPDLIVSCGHDLTIANNYLHDHDSQALWIGSCVNATPGNVLIYNNVFANLTSGAGVINIQNDANYNAILTGYFRIFNNTAYNNSAGWGHISASTHPIDMSAITEISFINNVAQLNSNFGFCDGWSGTITCNNAIITADNNIYGSTVFGHNGIQYSGLAAWQSHLGGCPGSGNECNSTIVSDPKYVNPVKGDFQLQSASPAISAGANLSNYFTTDKIGKERSKQSAWDIGAYAIQGQNPLSSPTGLHVDLPSQQ